jgi:hypothetical protein
MPYVVKHRRPPEPWRQFRKKARHPSLLPVVCFDWLCEQTVFYLGQWSFLEVLEYLGSFSILVAVVLYFAESGERRQQKHYQAWQVINTAQGKGGSGGRLEALRQLNEDRVPLVGVELDKAFLQGVMLDRAELRRASFREADLRNANFRHASLQDADFSSANLRQADVREADLTGANLADSDLSDADFSWANLQGVNLNKADLRGLNLAGTLNWQQIQSMELANVEGIKNAPEGFVQFALQHGAVRTASTDRWNDAIRRAQRDGGA